MWSLVIVLLEINMSQRTHLDHVPVVCELLQEGGVEAEGRQGRGRDGTVVGGVLQRGQVFRGEARQRGEEEADVVHVLQSGVLAAHAPATQRGPGGQYT